MGRHTQWHRPERVSKTQHHSQVPFDDRLALGPYPVVEASNATRSIPSATIRNIPWTVLNFCFRRQQLLHIHWRPVLPCGPANGNAVADDKNVWQFCGRLVTRPALTAHRATKAVTTAPRHVCQRRNVDAAFPSHRLNMGTSSTALPRQGRMCLSCFRSALLQLRPTIRRRSSPLSSPHTRDAARACH
jgi:hypothetical protein